MITFASIDYALGIIGLGLGFYLGRKYDLIKDWLESE